MTEIAIVSSCEKCGGWCCRCISIFEHLYLLKNSKAFPFWRILSPSKAKMINPWLPRIPGKKTVFFTCDYLVNGLCSNYESRPSTCKEYPDFENQLSDYLDNPDLFYVPWCYYRSVVCEVLGIPYKFLEDGIQCQDFYLTQILVDPQAVNSYTNPNFLRSLALKNFKGGMDVVHPK